MLTYEEWKQLGFQVEKGQKSTARNKEGKAVFSEDQVLDLSPELDVNDERYYWDDPHD